MAQAQQAEPARSRGDAPMQPTLVYETRLWDAGYRLVAGVDEAGRGALAGPVFAAAVIVARGSACSGIWAEVRDSKLLAAATRCRLASAIQAAAQAWAVGSASAAEIDSLGIAPATRLAMRRALEMLTPAPDYLLIDWVQLRELPLPQLSLVKADRHIASVAAASILAKVARDALMTELDARYPVYGFAAHKGYGARRHLDALDAVGPCPEHRRSFAPLARRVSLFEDGDRHVP